MKGDLIYIPGSSGRDEEMEKWLISYSEKNNLSLNTFYLWKDKQSLEELSIKEILQGLKDYYLSLNFEHPPLIIGKSFGGGVALLSGLKFEKVVLWSPVINISDEPFPFEEKLKNLKSFFDINLSKTVAQQIDSEILIIRGDRDEVISKDDVQNYLQSLSNSKALEIPNMAHSPKTKEDFKQLFDLSFEFLNNKF